MFVALGAQFVSVKDHGAIGDGIADDRAAIQVAVDALAVLGGGTLFFPPGTYWANTPVFLRTNNLTITGTNATLLKKKTSSHATYFVANSNGAQGYGSSVRNLTVQGLRFLGDFSSGTIGNTSLALHHAQDVLVYDCVFEQCLKLGHILDLQGCDGVTVRDCTVLGKSVVTEDSRYKEAIQIDVSTLAGASYADTLSSYDGLPTINVTVDGCKFLPVTVGATTYPAPNPVGSHACIEGRYYRNITVSNCHNQDAVSDTTSSYLGLLHFVAAENVTIRDNRFISTTGQPTTCVMFYRTHIGRALKDVAVTASNVAFVVPLVPRNITIRGNHFEGFTSISTEPNLIYVSGDPDSGTKATGVDISGNRFIRCTPDYTANVGANAIYAAQVSGMTVVGNSGKILRRLFFGVSIDSASISGNTVDGSYNNVITLSESSSDSTVAGNIIRNYDGYAIRVYGASTIVSIIGNLLRGMRGVSSTGTPIAVEGSTFVKTSQNTLVQDQTRPVGIFYSSSSTGGAVDSNMIAGFTTPIAA